MLISVISQTIRQNSVVLLFGTESKSYLIIVLQEEWRLRAQVSGAWGKKGAFCTAHL